jgi:hypothetical protein
MKFFDAFKTWLCAVLLAAISVAGQAAQPTGESTTAKSIEFVGLARAPQSRAQVGKMLAVHAHVSNNGNRVAYAELVGRISGQTGEEDRRRVEVPPGRTQTYELNLRILPTYDKKLVEAVVTLNVIENGREIMVLRGDDPVTQTLTTEINSASSRTAIALDTEPMDVQFWRYPPQEIHGSYEMVIATRVDSSLSRACMTLDGFPLPVHLSDWKGIDLLVIAKEDVLKDGSSIAAMQQFLHSGGRIWVMLDKVDTRLIEPLLAADQQCQTVDSFEANRFVIEVTGATDYSIEDRTYDSDRAVQVKRVLQTGGRVTHRIDGWPAAIWYPVSRGELLVTTIESHGWLKRRTTQSSNDPLYNSNFGLPVWGGTFANEVHNPKADLMLENKEIEYPLSRIGNPTVPRGLVTTVLACFCGLLALVGGWRWMAGELRWMGLLAPVFALAASIPLLIAAVAQRREMPDMVSILQIVEYGPRNSGLMREKAAVYSSSSRNMELTSDSDGYALPSATIGSGIRKLTTENFEKWKLSNEAWPPGTWRYSTEATTADGPYSARASLNSQGLTVEVPENFSARIEDAVISYAPGIPCLGKNSPSNKSWLMDGSLPAGGDRWSSESFVSEEQLRRASVYRDLFTVSGETRSPRSPTLFGWTELQTQGTRWNVELDRRGAALVAMPIVLATPEVGTEVFVPYSMVRIEAPASGGNSLYNSSAARWIDESNLDTQSKVAFVLPPEVVPLEISRIDIDWDIKAPKRNVQLYWTGDDAKVELAVLAEPSIPWKSSVDDPKVLKDFADGRLELQIDVTGNAGAGGNNFVSWQLRHLRLSVTGRTLPRNNLAAKPSN